MAALDEQEGILRQAVERAGFATPIAHATAAAFTVGARIEWRRIAPRHRAGRRRARMSTLRLSTRTAQPAPPDPAPVPVSQPALVATAPPERTPEEKAERARLQAERERGEQIAARRRQGRYLREGLAELRQHWPDLFTTLVPLAVGVGLQIRAVLPEMPYAQFRLVLRHWTQGTAYLQAVAAGMERRNLDGSPAGTPAEDQETFAPEALRKRGKWPEQEPSATLPQAADPAAGK